MATKKTKLSTITAVIATVAVIATLGTIGGIGQQQLVLAQELNLDDVDDLLDDIGSEEREICQSFQLPNQPGTICFRPPEALPCLDGVLAEIATGAVGEEVPRLFICS